VFDRSLCLVVLLLKKTVPMLAGFYYDVQSRIGVLQDSESDESFNFTA
jgi:hypothetical protein